MLARNQSRRAAQCIVGAMLVGSLIGERIKGIELMMLLGAGAQTNHARYIVDLKIQGPRSIGHNQVLRFAVIQVNRIRALREKVDGRRAIKGYVVLIDGV